MAKALQLEIQGTSNFSFSVEGEWFPRRELVFREASNPPQLVEIRDVWDFRGCRIVSSNGTTATLWTEFGAFLARLETRASFPTYARLVRDPSGAAAEVWKLGGTGTEGFRIESVELRTDEGTPAATWQTVASVDLRVSCVRRYADATTGIVGWTQRVSVSYTDGLRTLEWLTRVTTAEGVSAVDKAKTYAVIPASALGGDHAYATNGPDGIEYETPDADETASRTPTICEARSRIRQFGVSTGVTSPGSSPNDFGFTVETTTTNEETVETTTASARGPGALAWVRSKAPGSFTESVIRDERAANAASGTWTRRTTPRAVDDTRRPSIRVEISGGYSAPSVDFEATTSRRSLKFFGPGSPWKAVATVAVEARGLELEREDLLLPGALPGPWILSVGESRETDPERVEAGINAAQDLWRREATLVFYAVEDPDFSASLSGAMRAATPVATHLMRVA